MGWIRSFRFKLFLALSLTLLLFASLSTLVRIPSALAQGIPEQWEARKFQPPSGIGIPSRREGAASRGNCSTDGKALTALVPINTFGVTGEAYPTLLFYLPTMQPGTAPPVVEFRLMDETEQYVYTATFNTVGKSGIVTITLPSFAGLPPLEVGKDYQWILSLNCNPQEQDSSGIVFVSGQIRRVPVNITLYSRLRQTSSLEERASLYAGAEIWHDALMALAELRRANPNDPVAIAQWERLLKSVQLEDLANAPFVELN